MKTTRRSFLAGGLLVPGALASRRVQDAGPLPLRYASQQASEVRYRELGSTGLKVSSLGFGCMLTSDPTVIERAADLGINYFDTARGYQGGNNERMVGAALKSRRQKVYISTKSGANTTEALLKDLETSLKELGTDYVDIWCLHGRSSLDQITDQHLEAFARAKKDGKIRFSGISTHAGQKQLLPALAQNPHIDVIITAYNFTMDAEMAAAIEQARKAGKGIIAMKVMAGGFRRAKPGTPLHEKFQREGVFVAALKWVLANPNVDSTIPSMTDMEQLEQNMRAMVEPLTEADRQLLAEQLDYIRPLYCRMCGACEGACPKGMPVADVLRCLSYVEGYGQFAFARDSYYTLPEVARSVQCRQCDSCAVRCPNGVQVHERLIRAQELLV